MCKLSVVYLKPNGDVEYLPCVLPAETRDKLLKVAEDYFRETGIRGYFMGIEMN